MSFRQFGGLQYAPINNITRTHYSSQDQSTVSDAIGRINTKIVYQSHIDMSGNSLLNVETIYFVDGTSLSTGSLQQQQIQQIQQLQQQVQQLQQLQQQQQQQQQQLQQRKN
jgi:TolA-binding protein